MFQGSSHLLNVSAFTTWRIFTISTQKTPQRIQTPILYTRGEAQSEYIKQITSTQERAQSQYSSTQEKGTKPNAQSKLKVTIIGDHKDHKQKSHNTW